MASFDGVVVKEVSKKSSHGYFCCVPDCNNRSVKNSSLSFHRFPSAERNNDLRRAWLQAIRRDVGPNFQITSNTRVCSSHFLSDDYRKSPISSIDLGQSRRNLLPEAVPSLFSWRTKKTLRPPPLDRSHLEPPRKRRRVKQEMSPAELKMKNKIVREDHDYLPTLPCGAELPPGVLEHIRTLEKENAVLRDQVEDLKQRMTTIENLKDDDSSFSAATGLPNYGVFKALANYLSPKASRLMWWRGKETVRRLCAAGKAAHSERGYEHRLSVDEQFFAVLVRLRTNVSVRELSRRLKITQSSFSRMFTTWINFLAKELEALNAFTARTCASRGASSFKNFPRTRMIIDCTEVYTERPSGLKARQQLFSNYKHHNTIKFLVGTSPNGSVVYVSRVLVTSAAVSCAR